MTLCLFMIPGLQKPRFRPVRGSVFVLLGIMSGLPIVHLQFFMEPGLISFDPYHFLLGGALYIIGAFLYMLKIPERFSPGTFDIVVSNKNHKI
jgi:adiponectin receptor